MIGKSHLAVALGYAACLRGHSVLFAAAIDMVNRLSAAESNRQLARKIKRYQSPKILLIDELEYLPLDERGAEALFQVITKRYERGVDYRNAIEHPEGHSGTLNIRNFRLFPNGKFSVPAWWIERDGTAGVESPIGNEFNERTIRVLQESVANPVPTSGPHTERDKGSTSHLSILHWVIPC